ncbi:MAG TPA: enolase C-terminal domain-like protein [Solirubrobacterales bacterium]|jgi:o-succinylbenzoate synthase|nr:enolase C-terminal domain-like protein [Solirubrobacterales bacterium]
MLIERFEVFPLRLPLSRPFETATGVIDVRRVAVLRVTAEDGTIGLGEVTPYPDPRLDSLDDFVSVLESEARTRLEGADIQQTAALMDDLGGRLPSPALAAVDVALMDLHARQLGVPLAELFDRPARATVMVNATIAAADPNEAARQAATAAESGYRCLKIKVGLPDDDWRVAAIRDAVGYDVTLRLDANGAWYSREAIDNIRRLAEHGIELIEQPVKAGDLQGMHVVRDEVLVPIVADEGVRDGDDLRKHIEFGACDGIAVKIAQVGGLARANALVEQAERAGMFTFLTSTLDGPVGLAASLHFAASRKEIEVACGLATGELFAETYATGLPSVVNGELRWTDAPGLGIELDEDALVALAV